jgi:hypothetical protein
MNSIKRNLLLGAASAAATVVIAVPVFAHGFGAGNGAVASEKRGPGPVDREAMHTAIENADYAAWAELVGDRPVAEQVTAENFALYAEMHQKFQDGDREGAQELREQLGLPERGPKGERHKRGRGHRQGLRHGLRDGEGLRFQDRNGDGYCDHLDRSVDNAE